MEAVYIFKKEKKKKDILDIIAFFLLSVLFPFLFISNFKQTEGSGNFFLNISYDFSSAPSLIYTISVLVPFFLLITFLFLRCWKGIKKDFKFYAITVSFVIFLISRIISYVMFPQGDAVFSFYSTRADSLVEASYNFDVYSRVYSCFADIAFFSYFPVLLLVIPTFTKNFRRYIVVSQIFLILVALSASIYSIITQKDALLHNVDYLLGRTDEYFHLVHSFTGNKNTFGFLLLLGTLAAMQLYCWKPNLIYVVVIIFFIAMNLLINCRTTLFLEIAAFGVTCLVTPFFHFKKHKICASVSFLIGLAGLGGLIYLLVNHGGPIEEILDELFNNKTMQARQALARTALDLMVDPLRVSVGYGSLAFYNLIASFMTNLHYPDPVYSSHMGGIQIYCHFGAIGVVLSLLLVIYLIYCMFRSLKFSTNKALPLFQMGCLILLFGYSYSEPRFNSLNEGSTILLIYLLVLPIIESRRYISSAEGIRERKLSLLTDGLLQRRSKKCTKNSRKAG